MYLGLVMSPFMDYDWNHKVASFKTVFVYNYDLDRLFYGETYVTILLMYLRISIGFVQQYNQTGCLSMIYFRTLINYFQAYKVA